MTTRFASIITLLAVLSVPTMTHALTVEVINIAADSSQRGIRNVTSAEATGGNTSVSAFSRNIAGSSGSVTVDVRTRASDTPPTDNAAGQKDATMPTTPVQPVRAEQSTIAPQGTDTPTENGVQTADNAPRKQQGWISTFVAFWNGMVHLFWPAT